MTISDPLKKHIRVMLYLSISSGLAYVATLLTGKEEALYFMPIINYILFVIEKELKEDGVVKTMLKG